MKVYVVTAGEYSDYSIIRIFANRADAEAYEFGDDIDEWDVAQGPVEVRTWHMITWRPEWTANPPHTAPNPYIGTDRRDFDGNERTCRHEWRNYPNNNLGPMLTIQGWQKERVDKVFSEQRAQYLALGRIPEQNATQGNEGER